MRTIYDVLLIVLAVKFLFCSVAKLRWYRDTILFASNLEYFPDQLGRILGMILPLFELAMFISLLLFNSIYTYVLICFYCLFFIALNIKVITERKSVACFCYGKLIKSKLGFGGFFNFSCYLIITIICLLISSDSLLVVMDTIRLNEILPISLASIGIFWGVLLGQLYGDQLSGRV
ncbi:MAG: hypothetical protein FWG67_06315 [Defluviitaleaceae bacterium]|nr:hypothetical protein [Defluviitaleaceae bacterium]